MPQVAREPAPNLRMPSAPDGYLIRPCRGMAELEACVQLQQQVWGYEPAEVYPVRLLVNLTHIGGHVLGVFKHGSSTRKRARRAAQQTDGLVGFVMAMPAWRDGLRYLHSLSLAVAPGHENQGLGRLLKLAQRELAMEQGIGHVEWTFDPLRAKNAFLNIERLGAITRRYQPDYYGTVRSKLQQGLPSDRLVCEWWLRSKRVRRALGPAASGTGLGSAPCDVKPTAVIAIPMDFGSLVEPDPHRALATQRSVRQKFERCFRQGLVVTGFERGGDVGRYTLEPWQQRTSKHRDTEAQREDK